MSQRKKQANWTSDCVSNIQYICIEFIQIIFALVKVKVAWSFLQIALRAKNENSDYAVLMNFGRKKTALLKYIQKRSIVFLKWDGEAGQTHPKNLNNKKKKKQILEIMQIFIRWVGGGGGWGTQYTFKFNYTVHLLFSFQFFTWTHKIRGEGNSMVIHFFHM